MSLTVIGDGFNRSFNDGFRAIREEAINAFTRAREIQSPEAAAFGLTYEVKNNRLYWPGDRLSVEHHLRRNIVWLKANGGSETQLEQARLDLVVFGEVQTRALGLNDGQGVMWLAQRTTVATDGVALQQIRRDGDKLIQSSQLLPFDQQPQIDNFMDSINENREIVSVEDGVGGWIVQGKVINFEQDLPGMIEQIEQPHVADLNFNLGMPPIFNERLFQTIPRINMSMNPSLAARQPDMPVPASELFSFWFMATADALSTDTTQIPKFEAVRTSSSEPEVTEVIEEAVTSGPGLEVLSVPELVVTETQTLEYISHVASSSEPKAAEIVDITAVFEQTRRILAVAEERLQTNLEGGQKAEKTVMDKRHAAVSELSRKEPGKTEKNKKDKSSAVVHKLSLPILDKTQVVKKPKRQTIVFRAPEPPVYEVNEKEIPVWQPKIMAAIGDYTIYILAFFWAILNKNLIRLSVSRGSGW